MQVRPIKNIERKKSLRIPHPEIDTTLSKVESLKKDKPLVLIVDVHDTIFGTMKCTLG